MNTDIRFIFFDLGGTFRVIKEDPAYLPLPKPRLRSCAAFRWRTPAPGLTPSLTNGTTSTGSGP